MGTKVLFLIRGFEEWFVHSKKILDQTFVMSTKKYYTFVILQVSGLSTATGQESLALLYLATMQSLAVRKRCY